MDYKSLPDLTLWEHCRKDNVKAYNVLFERYFPKLLRVSALYLKDSMQAEELCMDLLHHLWVKRQQLDINTSLSNYLFRSIRNRLISHLRKHDQETTPLEELPDEREADQSADHMLRAREAEQAYEDARNKLSPKRRQVFELSREQNKSYAEIAKEMNLSVNTVENHMVSALNSLRQDLQKLLTR